MPAAWITAPNGTATFGTIPTIVDPIDAELCCPAGEIRSEVGTIAQGFVHLASGSRRDRFGGTDIVRSVYGITNAYDEIWVQRGRGTLLLKRTREGQRVAVVPVRRIEGLDAVLTVFPTPRPLNHGRRREVRIWSR